jgi:sugar lactone lactonase YvrE
MKNKFCSFCVITIFLAGANAALAAGQDWKLLFSLQADKTTGALTHPTGLFIDTQAERYYVADSGHNRLVSFDKEGKILHAFTAGSALDKPIAMTKRGDGRLLVLEKGKAALTEIDIKSRAVTPHLLTDRGEAIYPQRLQAANDRFLIIDQASGDVVILDQTLAVHRRLPCPDCAAGYADLSVKGDLLYALPMLGAEVHVFDKTETLVKKIPLRPAPEFPISLALAPDGGIFILERHQGTVAHYQADGRLLARHLGAGQREGSLSYPAAIQVDPWGRVCVVEEGNGRVSVFQP